MFSSEDEQDDGNIFDQLRSIRPFTIDQLYLLHPDVGCPPSLSSRQRSDNDKNTSVNQEQDIYQTLVEHQQLRHKLSDLRCRVKGIYKEAYEHVDKAWVFKEDSIRRIAMCQQGKIAETTLKYKQAFISSKHLDMFALGFGQLIETISKDYIYYSFESQLKRNKIATKFTLAYQIEDIDERRERLKSILKTLIDFIRQIGDTKCDFVVQCQKWFRTLARRMLDEATTENYCFVVSQISRGPVGTADWSSDLIECKPFEQMPIFETVPQYITHCSSLLTELFNSLGSIIQLISADQESNSIGEKKPESIENKEPKASNESQSDQLWSLVDPRFVCTEELNISSSLVVLSETDVIKICMKIPVVQIFRAYVKQCLAGSDNDSCSEAGKNYEYIMLKLLTIGTIIIKTYQVGLETFNSIQYGSLIEYLSSQIRRTVIILSEKWIEFKNRLRGVDDALLMRLQVEYDNFMLRSIVIILELRQSGIWRHLSRIQHDQDGLVHDIENQSEMEENPQGWSTDSLRPAFVKLLQVTGISSQNGPSNQSQMIDDKEAIPFKNDRVKPRLSSSSSSLTYEFSIEWFREVSEPMLWHILWQFYHNAFVSFCDYNNDNYWLDKFSEKSVVYLFVNKIKSYPPGECSYLLNSITCMLLSRSRPDSKLIDFIATEIFNLSFKHEVLKNKVTRLGVRSLIRSAEKFPNLISLYLSLLVDLNYSMPDADLNQDLIDLVSGCSLRGWLFNEAELELLSSWLIEFPIDSTQSRVARIIFSKVLLNSPENSDETNSQSSFISRTPMKNKSIRRVSSTNSFRLALSAANSNVKHCFVDLKIRRKLALVLYEACQRHLPEKNEFGPLSLGASVEVAFGSLYCEQNATMQNNLIELADQTSFQQFYVWAWRLLFTLRLHILNQPKTDWNDVKSVSGTSRSVKNTILIADQYHPAPTLQDLECLSLANGVKNLVPMASFIYLMLTDATWQDETFHDCLSHLNVLVKSGHLTPSLMAMKYFTTCHFDELYPKAAKDKKCLEYFTEIIIGNYDATRLASLIMSQLDQLKQYRQLQLSQFYVSILLEVSSFVLKQISSSWFASSEVSLEKIANLLDYLVKFNFPTQRMDIIHKFYDCAYVMQDGSGQQTSWIGSLLNSNSVNASTSKREFVTNLHILSQKFKKFAWLRWITTECDSLRLEKIWEDIVAYLSCNDDANLDSAIRRVCSHVNSTILKQILPINSWTKQIFDLMESDLSHPLSPLIWYNFFLHYFANSLNGTSVGFKLIHPDVSAKLMSRLDALFNYHLYKQRNWSSPTNGPNQQRMQYPVNSLAQLYRAYKLWLQDSSLRDAYVDMDKLSDEYLVGLLKAVMESSNGSDSCLPYIDLQSIETQNRNLIQLWLTATRLTGNHSIKEMIFVEGTADDSMEMLTSVDDEASDATSLIAARGYRQQLSDSKLRASIIEPHRPSQTLVSTTASLISEDELSKPLSEDLLLPEQYRTIDELVELIISRFKYVFEDANIFNTNISELDRTKSEMIELIKKLYKNTKRELVRVVACSDANECIGPARIKLEFEEATMDERKNHCIQDRRRQCQELVGELLLMPKNKSIHSAVIIEQALRGLMADSGRAKQTIETLLRWISEPQNYNHLSGNYYVTNHSLRLCLEILSSSSEHVDTYNKALIDVCLDHSESVQIFSPHLSPAACSNECFLQLYKSIASEARHAQLNPTATFVLLSKFDLAHWLDKLNENKPPLQQDNRWMLHELIKATCSALKNLGKNPDESYELAMGLFRRHLQIELAPPDRRRSEELMLLLNQFLEIMSTQRLAPSLLLDFMSFIGLQSYKSKNHVSASSKLIKAVATSPRPATFSPIKPSVLNNSVLSLALNLPDGDQEDESASMERLIDTLAKQADSQMMFDYHSLDRMVKMLSDFMQSQNGLYENCTLLEVFSDYLENYSSLMLGVTFMWTKSISENYPDNHELIWKQFKALWYDWVFLEKNCQNVSKSDYTLVASYFVASIRYMILKMPANTQSILQSTLLDLTHYVVQTKEVVYLELTILQRALKNLPWSSLVASMDDYANLCTLSEQDNFNVSDLIGHIVMQLDAKESLNYIAQHQREHVPFVSERLARTIILQSAHLKGYRLHSLYFDSIRLDEISHLIKMVLDRLEFVNLEHNPTNKLLVNLLRFVCIKIDFNNQHDHHHLYYQQEDSFKRSILYAQFVSDYLVNLIKRLPTVTKFHRNYLSAVLDNSLQDLKLFLLSSELNISQKTIVYEALLECCSMDSIELEQRLLLIELLLESSLLKNRPLVVLEILHASGQILRDGKVLVEAVEELIQLYLSLNGHYEKVWRSFSLRVLPSDIYLTSCIESKSSLALLIYFESLVRETSAQDQSQADTSTMLVDDQTSGAASNLQAINQQRQSSSFAYNSNRIWSSFLHWLGQLVTAVAANNANSDTVSCDQKLAVILPKMLELFEPFLSHFVHAELASAVSSEVVCVQRLQEAVVDCEQHANTNQLDVSGQHNTTSECDASSQTTTQEAEEKKSNTTMGSYFSSKKQQVDLSSKLQAHHTCLLNLIKDLIGLYDTLNSASIWSYLTIAISTARSEHSARLSITALAVATFLIERTLASLGLPASASQDTILARKAPESLLALQAEMVKLRRMAASRLESARKSKNFLSCSQFIETVIECLQRSSGDKIRYIEGVQLIITYVRLAFGHHLHSAIFQLEH